MTILKHTSQGYVSEFYDALNPFKTLFQAIIMHL
jgi:hypothetical protein